jgi:ATP-binding cassette subfamily C protein CydCD
LTAAETKEAGALGVGAAVGLFLQGLAVTGAMALAIPKVIDGELAPVWLAVIALLPLALFDVINTVPAAAIARERVRGSATRIEEIAEASGPTESSEIAVHATAAEGFTSLRLRGVSARWPGAELDALTDVDLEIHPAQRVLIMGPSGSGKSTLAAVIMGFLPYEGSAQLNGVEIRELGSDRVTERIGLLSQHTHVFDTSVEENVRLGRVGASTEEVWDVLERAQLSDWVRSLPEGVDTRVGAFGARMSGGERQRLALARLLLANRPALVLDEPTEHLDRQTAADVEATIADQTAGVASIVISHQVLGDVDHVIEMNDGRIVASGTHEQLLAQGGWYAAQVQRQREGEQMLHVMNELTPGIAVQL